MNVRSERRPARCGALLLLAGPLGACGPIVGWGEPHSDDTSGFGDETRPLVTWTSPAAGDDGVALNPAIIATFSEEMDPLTLTTEHITLSDGTAFLVGEVTAFDATVVFFPTDTLAPQTEFTATITSDVADLAGSGGEPAGVVCPAGDPGAWCHARWGGTLRDGRAPAAAVWHLAA